MTDQQKSDMPPPLTITALLQLSGGNGRKRLVRQDESAPNQREKQAEPSPVQAIDHIPHSIDETLVFLRVTDDEAVELLHIGINGVQSRRLSTTCMATAQDAGSKGSF